ncbi:LOW QUALITY PROTEIN: protein NRT1/ PTR FAMILY 2.4-like [Chenopodium quinoa]|uniref:LOW QUALITY PROTEIN: protein NRT1/ PTR FAMILY 2.4-like n=1 Tax=Chenopodium quinoa TaxID=63459 RepID=UPI000B76EE72|nr:LOW QUALITY PROTEIN: protein NRT1/ PTR FAMILY 2.4-like [Chenopodium quinoa]
MEHSYPQNEKAEDEASLQDVQICVNDNKGGWVTFPFIIGSMMGLTLAATSWYANIVVYAMKKYNIKDIAAAQFHNVVGGGVNFFPILAAILADSLFGSYSIVLVSSFISLLGAIMFTLSSAIPSLRPPPCTNITSCNPPSSLQYTFLNATLAILMIGFGGTRFVIGALGADQFKKPEQQRVFFNWFIFAIEASSVIGFTAVIYLQDKGKWTLSFGISAAVNAVAITLFLFGSRFYRLVLPQGSPFISIARVFVASFRKSRVSMAGEKGEDGYFYGTSKSKTDYYGSPTSSLSFFNRAALIKGGDHQQQSKPLTKSWILCTVEEVEDLKKLIKALPIWSGGILLNTVSGVAASLVILQALSMDRRLGRHFKLPAASILVFPLLCGSIALCLLDRVVYPLWKKIVGRPLDPLKRVGVGYFLTFLSMISFALIEKKRLNLMASNHVISVLWLILPLGLLGVSSSFYFPAELAFFYQELPKSLRSTTASLASLHMAVGYYLSTAFISVVQRSTSWLPDNINHGRMDKVYWTLAIIGTINFGYYLVCAKIYKYTNDESTDE